MLRITGFHCHIRPLHISASMRPQRNAADNGPLWSQGAMRATVHVFEHLVHFAGTLYNNVPLFV